MKYHVSKIAELGSVKNIEISKYTNIIVPLDKDSVEKIISGEIKISFLNAELQKKLVDEIRINKFNGDLGKTIWMSEINGDSKTVYMFSGSGCFKKEKIQFLAKVENFGAKLLNSCLKERILIVGDYISIPGEYTSSKMITQIALGFLQASYRFDRYMTTEKNKKKALKITDLSLFVTNATHLGDEIIKTKQVLDALYMVRDLVNEPANVLYPESYANIIVDDLKSIKNLTVKVIGEDELTKMGMHMLVGVGLGSDKESKVVIMEYKGDSTRTEDVDLALIGKGVTFDTGGISIKPAKGMEDMKGDMGGSAAVFGAIKLLATRGAKVNAVGIVGLVENMLNGSAQRPGDIVKSLSGQTVEVLNTDAEGRLVLGDILYYASTTYKPKHMIDLATLTGACVVALGSYYAAMYSTTDELADMLNLASKKTGESVWRMPLDPRFDKMNDSQFADMRNVTNTGQAGSITAAEFLKRFIGKTESWVHLDIAGVSDVGMESDIAQKGCSTAFGVKLLNQFVADNLEQ